MTAAPPDQDAELIEEYLRIGLRLDRVVPGFVDAYLGPARLREQVAAEPTADPAALSVQAADLARRIGDAGLGHSRADYLISHLDALAVNGRRLAGEQMTLVDEVEHYFQVRIEPTPTDVYAAAHAEISALIGGSGPLPARYEAVRDADLCPVDLVEPAVHRLAAALRAQVAPVGLPAGEQIDFEIAADAPWSGFNYYQGGYRSRVAINAGIGHRSSQLAVLTAHECYPGHHTEHCRKELLLVDGLGQLEHAIFLVNTPQCLMAEGLGDLALGAAVGPDWALWSREVLGDTVPAFDPDLVTALAAAARPLNTVRQNAAIMLHDQHADAEEVLDYVQRWALVSRRRAEQILRFLSDPLWRAYTSTYVEGDRLLQPWLDARPAEESAMTRFQRLLDEPLTPRQIRAELDAQPRSPLPAPR